MIQSVGTLAPLPPCFSTTSCPTPTPVSPTPISYANDPSLRLIDQLGGTPETFALAIGAPASGTTATGAYPYALIGVASNLPWHGKGVESSPLIKPGPALFYQPGFVLRDHHAQSRPCSRGALARSHGALHATDGRPNRHGQPRPVPDHVSEYRAMAVFVG